MNKERSVRWGAAGAALALLALDLSARLAPAQSPGAPPATPTGRIRQLLSVGDQVVGQSRAFGLGMFRQDPGALGGGVSVIQRVTDDGSLFMTDYAGVSLLRFQTEGNQGASTASMGSGQPEIVLDNSQRDPADGVGLARIMKVAINRSGVSAVLALRADSSYGVYRLDKGLLTRIALLPSAYELLELAIGDAGQIAYIAPYTAGTRSLLQTRIGGPPVEILRLGAPMAGGMVQWIGQLTSNARGNLAFSARVLTSDGLWKYAILRSRGGALETVAEGDTVEVGRGAGVTKPLCGVDGPVIGPTDTVVFLGGFCSEDPRDVVVNVFAQGPGLPLQPLLPRGDWIPGGYDYAIDASGTVAVRAQLLPSSPVWTTPWPSSIYLVPPTGSAKLIVDGQRGIRPIGRLTFDAHGDLFFLALDPGLPRDRYGLFPVRLYQHRRGTGSPSGTVREVDVSRSLPRKPGLVSITQPPVISADGVTVVALFGGSERFPVPTAGLFQVDPDGQMAARDNVVAVEADALPGADRIGIPQSLYYTNDGSLVADVVLPGGGTAAITVRSAAGTASRARTQAAQSAIVPLLATGQPLGRPDRTLLSFFGDLVPLGVDRQLVTARYSQAGQIGEGLFAVGRTQAVQLLADTIRSGGTTRFTSFSQPSGAIWGGPSVSPEGNVVFGVYEDRGGEVPKLGVFQWLRSSGTIVRMLSLSVEPVAPSYNQRSSGGEYPESNAGPWQAGQAGTAFILSGGILYRCSLRPGAQAAQVERLVDQTKTPVFASPTSPVGQPEPPIAHLDSFVANEAGELFVHIELGTTRWVGMKQGLFRVNQSNTALEPVAMTGDPLPPFADGKKIERFVFRDLILLRDSVRGPLLFRAGVNWGDGRSSYGLFRRNTQGRLETLLVEGLSVTGARDIDLAWLSDQTEQQTPDGTTAFAGLDFSSRWTISRTRAVRDATGRPVRDSEGNPRIEKVVVARDGQQLEAGRRLVSLNAVPLIRPEGQWFFRQGPIFALNNAGDVAFFASDGQRWGVYEFSDRA